MTRPTRILGIVAAGALALTACAGQSSPETGTDTGTGTDTATNGETTEGDAAQGGTIRVAETNAFTSFNPGVGANNLDINSKVLGLMRSDFIYLDNDLNIVQDESFGTYEVTSEDPLVVEYTVNESSVWSDGTPIDKGDMLLQWAVASGHFDGEPNDEGAADPAFFQFAGSTEGLSLTDMPEFSEDGRTMTLTYETPYVDWEIAYGLGGAMPAHVVATEAGLADEDALIELLETATPGEANEELSAVAEVWNTGFVTKDLPSNEGIYLSSGPMIASEMVADQSMTFVRNDQYGGDLVPNVDEITVQFIGDAAAAISALRNGEVDIIAPQPTVDSVQQVMGLDGVEVLQGSQLSYDHLDLSFDAEVFADENVRKAFLMTIPRDVIVDRLQKPLNENAEVLNSQLYLPSETELYPQAVAENGSDEYTLDIEGAKELLAGATPTVRILYNSNNPIRVDTFALIRDSATEAGFNIEDGGDADWASKLGDGSYDASIFGWISSGVGNAGVPQIFSSTGGGNYNAYSNPEVDALATELMTTTDADAAEAIKREIDGLLFADGYGLPLFQSPGMLAHADNIGGVEYMPNQTGVWWNFWEWSVNS